MPTKTQKLKAFFNHEEHEGHEDLVYPNLRDLRVLRGFLVFWCE